MMETPPTPCQSGHHKVYSSHVITASFHPGRRRWICQACLSEGIDVPDLGMDLYDRLIAEKGKMSGRRA